MAAPPVEMGSKRAGGPQDCSDLWTPLPPPKETQGHHGQVPLEPAILHSRPWQAGKIVEQ